MNIKKSAKAHYLQTGLLFASMFAAIPVIDSFATHPTYAADPPPVCQDLTAKLSDDKNHYDLSVAASAANNSDINGYQFDFGDHESYTFNFDNKSNSNRRQATVEHTYDKAGKYVVTVKVISAKSNQATQTSSNNCTVNITIAGTTDVLPATGPSTWTTLAIAGIIGIGAYVVTLQEVRKTHRRDMK